MLQTRVVKFRTINPTTIQIIDRRQIILMMAKKKTTISLVVQTTYSRAIRRQDRPSQSSRMIDVTWLLTNEWWLWYFYLVRFFTKKWWNFIINNIQFVDKTTWMQCYNDVFFVFLLIVMTSKWHDTNRIYTHFFWRDPNPNTPTLTRPTTRYRSTSELQ